MQVFSKFFQFSDLGTLPAFRTALGEKGVIFFTLAFSTDPTTSELTHPLAQMEVGFQAWYFMQKVREPSFGLESTQVSERTNILPLK